MSDRNIGGAAGGGGEADPDEAGGDAVERIGLRIDRQQFARISLGDQRIERGLIGDRDVGRTIDRRQFGKLAHSHAQLGLHGWPARVAQVGRRGHRQLAGQPREHRLETLVFEEGPQRIGRDAVELQRVEVLRQFHVAVERDELARQPRHLGMRFQIVAHFRRLHRRHRGEHALQIAIFDDQPGSGLWADAGDARDIVDGVAHQREYVAQSIWADAEFVDDIINRAPLVLHSG